ncbi:MAG: MFS transporter [Oligoflexus sp.]|nr:MFS transporter [Oligoflexus sp.]
MSRSESDNGHLGFLISGFASLFVISFLDNSRGPILPVLCAKLKIPYETAGTFLTIGCIAAVISTFSLGYFLKRKSERQVALGIALFCLVPGIVAPFVDSVATLLLLGALMGSAVTLMGTMTNILTIKGSPSHLRGRHLSLQQMMYGIGSLLAPLAFRNLIRLDLDWSWMLVGCSVAIFILGIAFYILLPSEPFAPLPVQEKKKLSVQAYLVAALFAIYVGGEVLASMWMSTLIVGHQGKPPEVAAVYGMGFFALIGATRFLCFLFVKPKWETRILVASLIAGIIASILGQRGITTALPFIGLLGPFFPLCMARISRQFPDDWKAMTIYVFIAIQAMLALMHQSVGSIADVLGIENAFVLCPVLLTIALGLLFQNVRASEATKLPSSL